MREAIGGAVRTGMGISVVSRTTVDNELALGLLTARSPRPALSRPFHLVRNRQKFRTHVMEELFGFAREDCARLEKDRMEPGGATRAE